MEHALLKKEEKQQQEKLEKLCEKEEKKQKEAKKQKYIEEEEEAFIDDKDNDPDFDLDAEEEVDPADMTIEGKDQGETFQVEKHSHALNFLEAGEFQVWVCGELQEPERAVKWGKDMEKHYKTFIAVLKDVVEKMGSYTPIEGANIDAVVKNYC